MTSPAFSSYSVAVVTPFGQDGSLEVAPVRDLIGGLADEGVPAFLVSGSTGEQHSLSVEERSKLYSWAVFAASGRPVYAGVAAVQTRDAVTLARAAERSNASGLMLGFPPYVRLTALDAEAYVNRVCEATDLPILLYNNPLRTAFDLQPASVERLAARWPQIRANKDSGDPARAAVIRAALGDDFQVFAGNDRGIVSLWDQGYNGLTSVAGNLWPREMAQVVGALGSGDRPRAEGLLATLAPALAGIVEVQLPASLKYALRQLGRPGGWCRDPLGHLGVEVEQAIDKLLLPWRS